MTSGVRYFRHAGNGQEKKNVKTKRTYSVSYIAINSSVLCLLFGSNFTFFMENGLSKNASSSSVACRRHRLRGEGGDLARRQSSRPLFINWLGIGLDVGAKI